MKDNLPRLMFEGGKAKMWPFENHKPPLVESYRTCSTSIASTIASDPVWLTTRPALAAGELSGAHLPAPSFAGTCALQRSGLSALSKDLRLDPVLSSTREAPFSDNFLFLCFFPEPATVGSRSSHTKKHVQGHTRGRSRVLDKRGLGE